tara:strand:+ start:9161 stop:11203 length:2043 start_codon:yes stop_codon:yes gene_type:complete
MKRESVSLSEQKLLFDQALKYLDSGDAAAAEAICVRVLGIHPNDANFLCLSARSLSKLELFDRADQRIDLALNLFPEFQRAHEIRGEILFSKGFLRESADVFRRVLALDPQRQNARVKLSQILMILGEEGEVEKLRQELLRDSQDNQDIARAVDFERQSKFSDAEKIYRKILTRHPDNVSAMRLWARLGLRQRQFKTSEVFLKRAVELAPGFEEAWADLCEAQYEQESFEDAINSAKRLVALQPRGSDGLLFLAASYASAGRHSEALDAYDKALKVSPDHVRALCGKGNLCRTIGNYELAVSSFRKSIEVNPLFAEAYWNLANLKTFRFTDEEVDKMAGLLDDDRMPSEGLVQLQNALGLEMEGRKDYAKAFKYFDGGNRIRREAEYYDMAEHDENIDNTIETFSHEFIVNNQGYGDPDSAPIFVVGLPRSGSTLIEQILSSHPQVDGTFELRDLGQTITSNPQLTTPRKRYPLSVANIPANLFSQLGGEYINRTRRHRGDRPRFTDKNPNNYVHVGFIHLALPNAKIIDARRHPMDSCFGSFKQLFAQGQSFSYDLVELGENYIQYQKLMDHWKKVLPGKVLEVNYESVVTDTETQVRRILEYCELDWSDSCLKFYETERAVKSASSEQVRTPIYSSAMHKWRHYEEYLGPLIEVLEPVLLKLPRADQPRSWQSGPVNV